MGAVVARELHPARAASRVARLRGRGAERARLDSVRDLASLHHWLAARREIDGSRAVLYGRSYGGYMVLAGLAFQPQLWAAGIEAVGISNLVAFLENTSPYRRAVR